MHSENYGVYGIRKVHAQLAREGVTGAERAAAGRPLHHPAADEGARPARHLAREGTAHDRARQRPGHPPGPGRAGSSPPTRRTGCGSPTSPTAAPTPAGSTPPSSLDVFSRRVVGWQLSTSLRTDLALDALNMGLWTRAHDGHDTSALVHHSDRGVQYLAVRYTERLAEAGVVASVGSKGDSYDNAMAEAFNSLFKAELVRNRGPVEEHRRPRDRRRRVHRLVQLPPPPRRDRPHPTRRVRGPAPKHRPARATRSAAVPSVHRTRYLTRRGGGPPFGARRRPDAGRQDQPLRRARGAALGRAARRDVREERRAATDVRRAAAPRQGPRLRPDRADGVPDRPSGARCSPAPTTRPPSRSRPGWSRRPGTRGRATTPASGRASARSCSPRCCSPQRTPVAACGRWRPGSTGGRRRR